jgi:hypothetical protein
MYKDKNKLYLYGKAYRKKHKARLRRLLKAYYRKHRRKWLLHAKKLYQQLKYDVFFHYCKGDIRCQCVGCSRTQICFLQIDHIKGGGRKDRKEGTFGVRLYQWLKKNNFPKGFQVLCACCNFSKRAKRRCKMYGKPH